MQVTPEDFVAVLKKTSLTIDERKAIIDLLKSLKMEQIQDLYKILAEDARDTQRILRKLETQNEKALLKLKKDVQNK